jgi:hypothetical protein
VYHNEEGCCGGMEWVYNEGLVVMKGRTFVVVDGSDGIREVPCKVGIE